MPALILIGSEQERRELITALQQAPDLALAGGLLGTGILAWLLLYSFFNQLKFAVIEIDNSNGQIRFNKGWINRRQQVLMTATVNAIDVAWERLQLKGGHNRYNAVLMIRTVDNQWYALCTSTRVAVIRRLVGVLQTMSGATLKAGALDVMNPAGAG
jgi:hypothetical protein